MNGWMDGRAKAQYVKVNDVSPSGHPAGQENEEKKQKKEKRIKR